MIDLSKYTLPEKAVIVAREIVKHTHDPVMIELARLLKTPENDLKWVKSHIKYQKEKGDVLYEPETTFQLGVGDCEDLSLLIGTLAKIQGYPVRLRIIANGTRHIYPIIKVNGEWRAFDATPHGSVITNDLGMPVNAPYHTVIDGLVTDNPREPLENMSLSGLNMSKIVGAVETGLGVAVGSAIGKVLAKKLGIGALSGFGLGSKKIRLIDIPPDYQPQVGDHLLFYYKPKWYLPSWAEKWIVKKIIKHKVPYAKIESANYKKINGHKSLVVEVTIIPDENLGSVTLAITAIAIAAAIIGGGLAAYFTIERIQKIVEEPQMASFLKYTPIAFLVLAGATLLSNFDELVGRSK